MPYGSKEKESYSPYAQTEWGVLKAEKPIPKLSHKYEFLNEPNSRKKLSKIRGELENTMRKIRRKRSERHYLWTFMAISLSVSTLLLYNVNHHLLLFIAISSSLYLFLVLFMVIKVLNPIQKDLSYLNLKEDFLRNKMQAVNEALLGSEQTTYKEGAPHRHGSRRKEHKG